VQRASRLQVLRVQMYACVGAENSNGHPIKHSCSSPWPKEGRCHTILDSYASGARYKCFHQLSQPLAVSSTCHKAPRL
jgi:hypothetical protein